MTHILSFQLNGAPVQALVKPSDSLLDVLREKLDVTSPKRGCDSGDCGACTVLLEGKAVRACLTCALTVENKQVVTVEGLSQDGKLQPLQEAFMAHGGSQCGYCTSGMLISATALLAKSPHPQRQDIAQEMSGNLCRCGCYEEITQAILDTARKGE
ncbi:MAG: (2Fe-2S)-binding protein [Proteobacteria bacterium]|nr:(2Fe-2S)-binding protein [Pseudomonadota bacterium]MBU4383670.1 (2Fe-2S)-binding protein [Pseudomonadota bacterium]MBU4604160.1 (2Fe-2S)-binding protein [Pseudomonadota bacterium]